jgi:hypothetical protein
MGNSVDDFFALLEKKAENGTKFVTWYGELYFELHRGTYTTQANNKRNNRKGEILMRDIELLSTLSSIKDVADTKRKAFKYPKSDVSKPRWSLVQKTFVLMSDRLMIFGRLSSFANSTTAFQVAQLECVTMTVTRY